VLPPALALFFFGDLGYFGVLFDGDFEVGDSSVG